ncbi:anti-sigma factor [Bacillus sp. FJAT-49736]|uniref:anti-sigma factor family protein n=1 Tax=Bacillus sp. FJAT-49736 TaxID=2833582 RepID=UPI0024B49642|nr:anti-sigma factor [Bacillus sp. FJAT-49736]
MNTCSKEIILYMHEYLDGELSANEEQVLKEHLQRCPECGKHFQELKKTVAYIKSNAHISAPNYFTRKVMEQLPKEKLRTGVKRWLQLHPILAAACVFIILMGGTVFSMWNNDQEFSFTKKPHLIVKDHTVIVPKGEVVKGDLIVKNGNLRVDGKVEGDVTVINGKKYMASAGSVTGNVEEINEIYDWLWFEMKDTGKKFVNLLK